MILTIKIQNLQQKNGILLIMNYSHHDPIKFLTKSAESSLCDYSDAYILVTGNINVTGGDNNTKVAFKNCAQFKDCRTEINDTFVDYADFVNHLNTDQILLVILMKMEKTETKKM